MKPSQVGRVAYEWLPPMAWPNLIHPSHVWGMVQLDELYMWTSDDKLIIFIIFTNSRALEKEGETFGHS